MWPFTKKEAELDREVSYHLESLAEGFERQGLSPSEAMQRARREFGGVEQFKEQCRDERRWRPLAQVRQDLSFGIRMLRKNPAVTWTAVLSLALGIGATTAMVGVVDAVLWRSLAAPDPQQLTEIVWQSKSRPEGLFQGTSGSNYRDGALSVADFFSHSAFQNMRSGAKGKAEVAGHLYPNDVSTSFQGRTAVAKLRPVSGNFFQMLRVPPMAGRLLTMDEESPQAGLAVVTSYAFWYSQLGGDAGVVGRTVRINNRTYVIAGILPRGFGGITIGDSTDLYTTIEQSPAMLDTESWLRAGTTNPKRWYIQLMARREPGLDRDSLGRALEPLFRATWVTQPANPDGAGTPTLRLQDAHSGLGGLRREMGNPVSLLMALVGLVLLMACANIANLLLARANARRKEVALRMSLGCSRARLAGQFFTESLLLAVLGGLLSIPVGWAAANFAVTLMPGDLRLNFEIDGLMILATLGVTTFTAVLFGLYPAWRASKLDTIPALKEGAGSIGGVREGKGFATGKVLVLVQVALGVLLVAAAAAFNMHLRKILSADSGFERTRLLLFDLRPGQSGYEGERLRQFYVNLEQRLRESPGVQAAGLARVRPMTGGGYNDTIGFPSVGSKSISTAVNFVTAGYLDALGVSIVGGRGISEIDIRNKAAVAVVSEDFTKELGRSPLGLYFEFSGKSVEVIGVARQARYSRLTAQPKVIYVPNALNGDTITAVVRTVLPPMQVLEGVKSTVAGMDPNLPMVRTITMEDQIALTLRRERLFAWLCGAFGCLALVLCTVGLYGVMSYTTTRRRQEVGIRMALGASPGSVLRLVIGEGMIVAIGGIVVGAPAAWWAAQKYVDHKRLGMEPLDPAVLAGAMTALIAAALLAVLAPALRAASVDPLRALHDE